MLNILEESIKFFLLWVSILLNFEEGVLFIMELVSLRFFRGFCVVYWIVEELFMEEISNMLYFYW